MSRRIRAMQRRANASARGTSRFGQVMNPDDVAATRSELAWMARLDDEALHTLGARLVMSVFDDDLIDAETADYPVDPGMPRPAPGGWRGPEDFVALGAARSARAARLTLARLEDDGFLEQLETSGRFRPVPG